MIMIKYNYDMKYFDFLLLYTDTHMMMDSYDLLPMREILHLTQLHGFNSIYKYNGATTF